jgi:hypothetical protein
VGGSGIDDVLGLPWGRAWCSEPAVKTEDCRKDKKIRDVRRQRKQGVGTEEKTWE